MHWSLNATREVMIQVTENVTASLNVHVLECCCYDMTVVENNFGHLETCLSFTVWLDKSSFHR